MLISLNNIRNIYIGYKIRNYSLIQGWLLKNEAIELYNYTKRLKNNATVLEIGCWKGRSSYCIAKALKNKSKLFVIDPFDGSGDEESKNNYKNNIGCNALLDEFKINMNKFNLLPKIEILNGYSKNYVGKVKNIDLLFIDGNHSIESCKFDFLNYAPLVNKGGYIALHDYNSHRKELGPTYVVENIIKNDNSYKFCKLVDSLWICKKTK